MPAQTPIRIKGLDHVVIGTQHIETMVTFYRDVLGCPVERQIDSIGLYQRRAGGSLIDLVDADGELGRQAGGPPRGDASSLDHFCVRVDPWDAQAIMAFLKDHGIKAGDVVSRYGADGTGPAIDITDPTAMVSNSRAHRTPDFELPSANQT